MKIVQKGNRQTRVADNRLAEMLSAGYVEIDEATGKPIHPPAAESDEVKALKKEITALKKDNKELAEQVAALTAQLSSEPPGAKTDEKK